MIKPKMETAFNKQINAETYSAYLYMAMAAYFEQQQLPGFAHWMIVQAQEELSHSMIFYRFVNDAGGKVALDAIAAPPGKWDSPLACIQAMLVHEQHVTRLIHSLMTLARKEDDYASEVFLQWFVKEQVEEEAGVNEILGKLKLAGKSDGALLMLDKEMAGRVFVMPGILTL